MKKVAILSVLIGTSLLSQAATVNWSAAIDTGFLTSASNNTTFLPIGNFVRIGYFSILDANILSLHNAGDITGLNGSFQEYANTTIGTGTDNFDGTFTKNSIADTSSGGNNLQNLQMYIWVLKATNNTSLAAALASTTEEAIFYVASGSNPSWKFPSGFSGDTTVDASDIHNGTANGLATGAQIVVGGYRSNVNRPDVAAAFGLPRVEGIQLAAPVPEPTSVFLIAAGAAGLMMRRRRQS